MYRKATRATELQECAPVGTLRKVLFLHAAAWGLVGIVCVLFARSILSALSFGEPIRAIYGFVQAQVAEPGVVFVRLLGVCLFALAMFMVLVAQKIEAVWWWSWGFVLADAAVAAIVLFHLAFGIPNGAPTLVWWIALVLCLGLAVATLWGLFKAQQDQPIIEA